MLFGFGALFEVVRGLVVGVFQGIFSPMREARKRGEAEERLEVEREKDKAAERYRDGVADRRSDVNDILQKQADEDSSS